MNTRFQPLQQNIAVIGAGVAGLSCAWLLRQQHRVTLFEANDYLGGHTHTLEVATDAGPQNVDTGFIVYNEPNYPQLTAMLQHLGVASRDTEMSFSVSLDQGRYEYAGTNPGTLFAQRRNLVRPNHWRMLADILRFNRQAKALLEDNPGSAETKGYDQSLGEFLDTGGFSQAMQEGYLLPMAAAIWSCPAAAMRAFPMRSFARFFQNHGLLNLVERPQWKTVVGGSQSYVQKLRKDLSDQRLASKVTAVIRHQRFVEVVYRDVRGLLHSERFDQVVMACHADQTRALIRQPRPLEKILLGAFDYQSNRAILHGDDRLMPRRRSVWSSWNYLGEQQDGVTQRVSVSYWMNQLQGLPTKAPLVVSLNPLEEPRADKVIAEMHYDHPVFDAKAMSAQGRLPLLQGQDRLWFCGSYFGYGFHEDALASSVAVAARLGCAPPWKAGTRHPHSGSVAATSLQTLGGGT